MSYKFLLILICMGILSNSVIGQSNCGKSVLVGRGFLIASFNDTARPQLRRVLSVQSNWFPQDASSISDFSTGKPILFSTGSSVFDTLGNIIDNGDHLVDSLLYYIHWPTKWQQSSIILPLGNKRYLLAISNTTDSSVKHCWDNLDCLPVVLNCDDWRYNIIDMSMNNGMGKVVVKNAHFLYKTFLKMTHQTACKHANGKDWWLFKPANDSVPKMYRVLITADSIYGPYVQNWDDGVVFDANRIGQMQFSPDGTKYASVLWFTNKIITGDFDRCTGLFSNRKVYKIPIDTLVTHPTPDSISFGVAFSPNNRFIYVSKSANVLQLDTQEQDSNLAWYLVKKDGDSVISIVYNSICEYNSLFNGPDGRIYVGHVAGAWGLGISSIDHPNVKGALCGWCNQCLNAPIADSFNLISFANQPNYALGPTNNPNC